jgi:hypothetical protein
MKIMNDQNKDNLEKFFKEGAQKYNIEFNEGDWRKLEARLDREMPVAFTFWSFLRKFWPIPLLIALIPAVWYAYFLYSRPDIDNSVNTEMAQEIENGDATGYITGQKLSEAKVPTEQMETSTSSLNTFSEISGATEDPDLNSYTNSGNSLSTRAAGVLQDRSTSGNQGISNLIDVSLTGDALNYLDNPFSIHRAGLPYLYPKPPVPERVEIRPSHRFDSGTLTEIDELGTHRIAFYTGIGFSPDFSTVGLGNYIKPGFRWKVMAEVEFSKRFSLNTGIVWVKNKYEAIGDEYDAPSGYWLNGVAADATYGKCVMLDVPLNVRYNFHTMGRHKLFISGGSSTYFLLKEDYYFNYDQDDPSLPTYWGTDKTSIYPFGIINLSFGYQYQLGRRGALQVEPFIKLPIGGVGWGDVKLHTVGVYFMYKYRLGKYL